MGCEQDQSTVRVRQSLCALAWAAAAVPALAATDHIETDRPDVVESSETVGKGRFQFEASVDIVRNRPGAGRREDSVSTPVLFRYGLTENVEARVETEGYLRERIADSAGSNTARGMGDTALGLKWKAVNGEEGTAIPDLAWILHFDIPSGSKQFRGHGVRPSLRANLEWELPHDLTLGMIPGVFRDRNQGGGDYIGASYAVALWKNWTDRFRTLLEWSAPHIARSTDGGSLVTLNVGAAYLINNDTQLDFALRRGMNANTSDYLLTIGWSMRF